MSGHSTSGSPKSSETPSTEQLDRQASQLILDALERTNSAQAPSINSPRSPEPSSRGTGSFGKMAFNSMMGGLSVLSLTRTSTSSAEDKEKDKEKEKEKEKEKDYRGRPLLKDKRARSSSVVPAADTDTERSRSRARSQSPFTFRRFRPRERDTSPVPQAVPLAQSDIDLPESSPQIRPRTAFADDLDSGDEGQGETDAETEDEEWVDESLFDPVTERNTERNSLIPAEGSFAGPDGDVDLDVDPTGEGVNVVVPPEPYFPSTLNAISGGSTRGKRNPRKRKSTRHHEPPPMETSRPVFQRDRCTIAITQGDPEGMLAESRRRRMYVVASDLSEESRYAVEWGIGTVLRDGDEMLIVTVVENENKVDPPIPNAADRAGKLRSQQERQGLAYILARQATALLQRTKLNVRVSCQAWHAKNARHMLLDIIDHNEPTMMIVGSRGLGQLKGILLGSTSHYLIQKSAVPVMVARRRLKRPPKRSAHLSLNRVHVSLAEAGIDRVVHKVDEDVKTMRDEIERDDQRRGGIAGSSRDTQLAAEEADGEDDEDAEDDLPGVKVAG